MPSKSKSDFILLSELIQKLEDKDYYRTYAKSLALTENSSKPLPADDKLVEQMFYYFIANNELVAYLNDSVASGEDILKDDVYVKTQDLKKLYANKCIVFPSSILKERPKKKI
jgi:hypothetical protein